MKYVLYIVFLHLIFFTNSYSKDFRYKVVGKMISNNEIKFPDGGKFIGFHHEGGFETNIERYGEYKCRGSMLYDKGSKLDNMFFACEFIDQNGDIFINMGKRLKGSDADRAVGNMTIIQGQGFWENYIGYKCTYAVEYVNKTIFAPTQCRK
ncbi:MAG: hypothetical protein CMP24_05430 [Rickettsiales bacterium]|nr:hypothetical protein [Rickettsiales bacterium]